MVYPRSEENFPENHDYWIILHVRCNSGTTKHICHSLCILDIDLQLLYSIKESCLCHSLFRHRIQRSVGCSRAFCVQRSIQQSNAYSAAWSTGQPGAQGSLEHRAAWSTGQRGLQGSVEHRAAWSTGQRGI